MNSSDLRLVRLIPTTGTGSFSGGGGSYWDSAGVLQTAPPNTLRVTYDPSDLSKAPYALIEPAASNLLRQSELFASAAWGKQGGITIDQGAAMAPNGQMAASLLREGVTTGAYITQDVAVEAGDRLALSVHAKPGPGERGLALVFTNSPVAINQIVTFDLATLEAAIVSGTPEWSVKRLPGGYVLCTAIAIAVTSGTVSIQIRPALNGNITYVGDGQSGNYIWGAMLANRGPSSYITTADAPVTRSADVVGPGAGLVYSNVPITEPLWAAGTYALGTKVRDAQNFVFESLAAGNAAPLTDKTKWLPLGITNRWKAFDKAVNSQTVAPGMLAFAVKPGGVATTLMLLNMEGASVTVSQSDSGYVRTKSLVSHEVDNWYDFYYEEPVRAGDAVFTDIPPYPNSMLTVAIDNGPLESKIGACLVGKPLVLGKVTASFTAGVLSYSTSTTDTFGNITMVKRYNAPRMNFEVMIPAGAEDVAYRALRDNTDIEIGIIVGDRLSMGIGYGFLGQWDVPKSGSGRTAPIEFKGLV